MSAAMKIGGTIRLIVQPEILADLAAGKLAEIEFGKVGESSYQELDLQLEPGPENKVSELQPWFDLDDAVLKIKNSAALDGPEYVQEYFGVYLEEREDRCLGFTLNGKQARALAEMLLGYARICEGIDQLTAAPPTA